MRSTWCTVYQVSYRGSFELSISTSKKNKAQSGQRRSKNALALQLCARFIMHLTEAERVEASDVFVAERESAVCVNNAICR